VAPTQPGLAPVLDFLEDGKQQQRLVGNATRLDVRQGAGGEGDGVHDGWLTTRRRLIVRQSQITLGDNGVITPILIVLVEFMDFVTCIALSNSLGDVEPRGSTTVETANVDRREVVLFSWVLVKFVRVTKARKVACRWHRDAPLNSKVQGFVC